MLPLDLRVSYEQSKGSFGFYLNEYLQIRHIKQGGLWQEGGGVAAC